MALFEIETQNRVNLNNMPSIVIVDTGRVNSVCRFRNWLTAHSRRVNQMFTKSDPYLLYEEIFRSSICAGSFYGENFVTGFVTAIGTIIY